MAAPQNAGLPDSLDLGGGYSIEFTALDPTSGADVTTVKVSLATLTIGNVSASVSPLPAPEPPLPAPVEPLWLNLPQDVPTTIGGPTGAGTVTLATLNQAVQADATLDAETKTWAAALSAALAA